MCVSLASSWARLRQPCDRCRKSCVTDAKYYIQRDTFIWKTPFFSEMTHFFSNPMYPTYNTATKLQQLFTDLEAGVCRILVIIGETLVDPGTGQIRQKVCSTLTTSISQQLLLQVTALAAWVLPVKRAAVQNNQ